jgi:hypothetical protein
MPFRLRPPSAATVLAFGAYLAIGYLVTRGLWRDPSGRVLENGPDQDLFEWWLAWDAHALEGLQYPLVSHLLNAPAGVNAMANTSVLALGYLAAPVTWLWGPGVTFALLITLSPALTGLATYVTLRRFDARPLAAFAGGLLVTLAPGLHSQGNGHLHMAMAALVPLLIGETVALATGRVGPRKGGIRLGLLAAAQLLIGEEWLAITAITALVLVAALAIAHPGRVRPAIGPLMRGLGIAVATAAPLVVVPLAVQLAGPQHTSTSPFDTTQYGADLKSFVIPSKLVLFSGAGSRARAPQLSGGLTEQTAYLGRVLLAFCALIAVLLRRDRRIWILLGAAGVMALLSLGAHLTLGGHHTSTRLPWGLVDSLPLLKQALPVRIALVVPLLLAGVVALAVEWALATRPSEPLVSRVVLVATAIALVSVAPNTLVTAPAAQPPAAWAQLPRHGSILTAPETSGGSSAPMRWEAAAGLPHALVGDYAIVPDNGRTILGPPASPTFQGLAGADGGHPPSLTPATRAGLLADLRRLHVSAVIALPDDKQPRYVAYLRGLLGPPTTDGASPVWLLRGS